MGLLSIFKRKSAESPGAEAAGRGAAKGAARSRPARGAAAATTYAVPPDAAEAVREARARARRRLMGATVLLLAGVIGFPLLFETQPRPIPVDLPIDIPARNAAVPNDASAQTAARPAHAGGGSSAAQPIAATPSTSALSESVSYDSRPMAAAPAAVAPVTPAPAPRTTAEPARATPAETVRAASAEPRSSSATPVDAAASRAYALLNPPSHAPSPDAASTAAPGAAHPGPDGDGVSDANRFVVQIGAFADDAKVHDARSKVEKLGLKTYTQSVDTPAGKRVRVRVGPYATRAEADKAAGRLKADGLQAVVLSL